MLEELPVAVTAPDAGAIVVDDEGTNEEAVAAFGPLVPTPPTLTPARDDEEDEEAAAAAAAA